MPEHRVVTQEEWQAARDELLATKYAIRIAHGSSLIEPANLSDREANFLQTAPGKPAFRIETSTYGDSGGVIDFEVDVYRGDRYRLMADLRPEPPLVT